MRPTNIRFVTAGVLTVMACLLYLDRYAVGIAAERMRVDLAMTQAQISWFLSAFFLGYALGQVPAGWLSDRFGPRLMLTFYILLWSFFTGWMGLAVSLAMLLALRLGSGLAQAGAYPTGASVISKWVEFPR